MYWLWLHYKYLQPNYSQVTTICCVKFANVVCMRLSHATAVQMTVNDSDEYCYWKITPFCCNSHCQTTIAKVTLQKAVISTSKIFAVHCSVYYKWILSRIWQSKISENECHTLRIHFLKSNIFFYRKILSTQLLMVGQLCIWQQIMDNLKFLSI